MKGTVWKLFWLGVFASLAIFLFAACQGNPGGLRGTIEIDGSSTVFPIAEAAAEEFRKENPGVQINVGVSGTGGGFKRFVVGETDISDASRPIKPSEADAAKKNGVEYIELRVGIDGLAVVVNSQNTFVSCLSVEELNEIWKPGSTVSTWRDVRPEWPNKSIKLYGPGTDSGTFDYFTEVINGESGASRPDYTASEDDNVLVRGVEGDKNALGYFGYAYYAQNSDKVKIVAIDSGAGCVTPIQETIESNEYTPLARPIFIYVNLEALESPHVEKFVRFYLENAPTLVSEVGYIPFPQEIYEQELQKLDRR